MKAPEPTVNRSRDEYDPVLKAVRIKLKKKYLSAKGDPSTSGKATRGK